MKALKIIYTIFGVLFAILLSIITYFLLLIIPAISTACDLLQPETLHKALKSWDLSQIIEKQMDNSSAESQSEFVALLVDGLLESPLVDDLLELYLENLLGIVEEDQMASITQKDIDLLLEKHMPDLISQVRPHIPEALEISDEDIMPYITQTLSPYLLKMANALPSLEDLGLHPSIIKIIHMLYNKTLLKYAYLIVILTSVLILLCRLPRFKGLIWITVVYTLAGFTILLLSEFSKPFSVNLFIPEFLSGLISTFNSFTQLVKSNMIQNGILCIIVAVISLLLYILSRVVRKSVAASKKTIAA